MTTGNMPEPREADRSMDRTEDEIERTIGDLHETVGELRERLSPDRIKSQVTHSIRDATVGKAERTMNRAKHRAEYESAGFMETLKQNPLPAAMAAFGIGWLFFNKKEARNHGSWPDESGRRGHGYDRWDEHSGSYQAPYGRRGGAWEERERDRRSTGMNPEHLAQRAGDAAEELRQRAGETAEDFQRRTEEFASTAQRRVGDLASGAQERVEEMGNEAQLWMEQMGDRAHHMMGEFGDQARYQARHAGGEFEKMWYQNPMGMAAVAFGVGAAVGLMLPETEAERELMGETRDKLAEQAGGLLEQGAQQAREQVERTMQGQMDGRERVGSSDGSFDGSTARQGALAGAAQRASTTPTMGEDSEAIPDGEGPR